MVEMGDAPSSPERPPLPTDSENPPHGQVVTSNPFLVFYPHKLHQARMVRRYKRFLMDVQLEDGTVVTVHCPNSGSMLGCLGEGWPVLLSAKPDGLPYTVEAVHNGTVWIGVHTGRCNTAARTAINLGFWPELAPPWSVIRQEVAVRPGVRLDLLLESPGRRVHVEVKHATMMTSAGIICFPDARSSRALKHMQTLQALAQCGHEAAVIFMADRLDATMVSPCDTIDPAFGAALRQAAAAGVMVLAAAMGPMTDGLLLQGPLPVTLEEPGYPRKSL
jgi:sugar fermentation stimulation protein A